MSKQLQKCVAEILLDRQHAQEETAAKEHFDAEWERLLRDMGGEG